MIGDNVNRILDAENHLSGVSGGATATFVYDGDGKRVKATVGGDLTPEKLNALLSEPKEKDQCIPQRH
jgi:hypothetical protein